MWVSLASDIYQVELDECGTPVYGMAFYAIAQDATGRRWAHSAVYKSHSRHVSSEGEVYYRADHFTAEKAATHLVARIKDRLAAGGELDLQHWSEMDPAYGSSAYSELDAWGYFRAAEIERARDAGEPISAHQI
jgi:hypothetical protein